MLLWEEFQFVDHEPCFLAGVGVPDGKPLLAEEAHFDVAHGACAAGTEGVAQASAVVVEVGGRVEELHLLPGAPAGAVDAPRGFDGQGPHHPVGGAVAGAGADLGEGGEVV